jgi:acylglycerol lipase
MVLMFFGVAAFAAAGAFALYILFGPGIDKENPRAKMPLSEEERAFLEKYTAKGEEETGYMHRSRPNNEVVKIFYRFWHPKIFESNDSSNKIKGVIVLLHGMHTHSGRMNHFVKELLEKGYVIAAIDHEGMGRSDGRHGYFSNFDHLVEDAIAFIELTKKKYEGHKTFLKGGSLGGLLSVHVLLKAPHLLDGAILLCPAIQVHERSRPTKFMENLGRFLCAYFPKIPIVKGNKGINNHPSIVKKIDAKKYADPLFYSGWVRVGTGISIMHGMSYVQDKFHLIETPYLLQHGVNDRVCHVSGSEGFHQKTRSKDKTFKKYPEGEHDLSCEPPHIRNAVVEDFCSWLDARC